jgi:hypothetical protein
VSTPSPQAPAHPPRITDGPQILCRMCGAVSNHHTGLCALHRDPEYCALVGLTEADRAYLAWKALREESAA